jgi:hypothetical protein
VRRRLDPEVGDGGKGGIGDIGMAEKRLLRQSTIVIIVSFVPKVLFPMLI